VRAKLKAPPAPCPRKVTVISSRCHGRYQFEHSRVDEHLYVNTFSQTKKRSARGMGEWATVHIRGTLGRRAEVEVLIHGGITILLEGDGIGVRAIKGEGRVGCEILWRFCRGSNSRDGMCACSVDGIYAICVRVLNSSIRARRLGLSTGRRGRRRWSPRERTFWCTQRFSNESKKGSIVTLDQSAYLPVRIVPR